MSRNQNITPKLRTALLVAMTGCKDLTSVGQLAVACRCDRTTLWRHWKQGIGADVDPKKVIRLILLLRELAAHNTPRRGTYAHAVLKTDFGLRPHGELNLFALVKKSDGYKEVLRAFAGELH